MTRRLTPLWLAALLLTVGTTAAAADPGQNQSADQSTSAPSRRSPDFFFGEPHGSITFRGGWIFASASSDLFDFVQDNLTIDKGAFNAPHFGFDVAAALTPRLDLVMGIEYSKPSIASEYRDLVDNNFLPITQETSLKEFNLSGGVKFALTERGRSVSRFAWVPKGVIPYVGGGGGVLYYDFRQSGDFVDYVDMSVFTDAFRSKGWAPSAHAFGGVDIQMYKSMFLNAEGRYLWGAGKLGRDFIDFDPIDLAGFRVSAGVQFVF